MNISISTNDRQARAVLSRAPNDVRVAMRGGMEDATSYIHVIISRYPAQRPGSTYTRTRILGDSWSRRITGSSTDLVGIVGSNGAMAPYNRYVQDADRQARVHQGRWQTIQDVAQDEAPTVVRMFEDRLNALGR